MEIEEIHLTKISLGLEVLLGMMENPKGLISLQFFN